MGAEGILHQHATTDFVEVSASSLQMLDYRDFTQTPFLGERAGDLQRGKDPTLQPVQNLSQSKNSFGVKYQLQEHEFTWGGCGSSP